MATKKPQFSIAELKRLQRAIRQYLKVGELELAENTFNAVKSYFKAA